MQQTKRSLLPRLAALSLAILVLASGCGTAKPQGQPAPETAKGGAPTGQGTQPEAQKPAAEPPKGPVKDAIKPMPGYQAPNFRATDAATGQAVSLADLRGQVVLVNFWATWCPPCKAEMPEMEALHKEMGDKVRIVAVGADARENPEMLNEFAKAMNLTFQIGYDGGAAAQAYRVTGIPTSYFIDKNGMIRVRYPGPMNLEQMKKFVAEASAEAKTETK